MSNGQEQQGTPSGSGEQIASVDDKELFLKLMLHADGLFHTRVNFVLATHAFLFAGVARMWSEALEGRRAVAFFAIMLTLVLMWTNQNLSAKLSWVEKKYASIDSRYAEYRDVREWGKKDDKFRSIHLFKWGLPAMAIIGWLGVLVAP